MREMVLARALLAALFWGLFDLSLGEYDRFAACLADGGSTESCEGQ
jgi:hypothetical protein